MRYALNGTNIIGWYLHDTVIHPLTGHIGLLARVIGSPRLAALAHHIHNVTAPSNDHMADYLEAAARAGRNETTAGEIRARPWSDLDNAEKGAVLAGMREGRVPPFCVGPNNPCEGPPPEEWSSYFTPEEIRDMPVFARMDPAVRRLQALHDSLRTLQAAGVLTAEEAAKLKSRVGEVK